MKTIAFFNNKGGVGKTVLVYHLAHMLARKGEAVVVADLDPQANLTSMFMSEEELEALWKDGETIYTAIRPLIDSTGDVKHPQWERRNDIVLIPGDMHLSRFEDALSEEWPKCMDRNQRAFRVETAFYRIIQAATQAQSVEWALIDIGPNLGAINRATLLACDYIITPLSPDLFSWQGLNNLRPALNDWREGWKKRLKEFDGMSATEGVDILVPPGKMEALGYITMRYNVRLSRPVQSYRKWLDRMPENFAKLIDQEMTDDIVAEHDENCLAILKDYFSLMPMAQEKRKPMFALTSADGAFGAHVNSVQSCYQDFDNLAEKIMEKVSARSSDE